MLYGSQGASGRVGDLQRGGLFKHDTLRMSENLVYYASIYGNK